MFFSREVTRVLVGAACSLLIANHAYSQASERETPFIAEVQFTDTFARAENGPLRNINWEVARDRSGRMRVDWGREVFIADPVKGRYFSLDTQAETVREYAMPPQSAAAGGPAGVPPTGGSTNARAVNGSNVKLLGTRIIGGYLCEGQLITQFINVDRGRPESGVKVETEAWVAKEIGPLLVITRTSEGRETRYALGNIRIEEAAPDRFAVPHGFRRTAGASTTISH